MAELSPVEIVALSKCVKDKEVTEARGKIPEASAHTVNFIVHVQGNLTRAGGTPTLVATVAESTRPANLATLDHFCAVLRELKIGPKRLDAALRAIAERTIEADDELRNIFTQAETDFAEVVPAREVTTPGKSGNVSVAVNVAKV